MSFPGPFAASVTDHRPDSPQVPTCMYCPNCNAEVASGMDECLNCAAVFNGIAWSPTPAPTGPLRTFRARPQPATGRTSRARSKKKHGTAHAIAAGVSSIAAAVVGLFLWSLALAVMGGGPFWSSASGQDRIIFAAPIAGLVMPLVCFSISLEKALTAAWLIALAPLASAVNLVLHVVASETTAPGAAVVRFWLVNAMWPTTALLIGICLVCAHSRASEGTEDAA